MGNKQGESKKYAATNNHKTSKIQCDIPQSARLKPTSNQSTSVTLSHLQKKMTPPPESDGRSTDGRTAGTAR